MISPISDTETLNSVVSLFNKYVVEVGSTYDLSDEILKCHISWKASVLTVPVYDEEFIGNLSDAITMLNVKSMLSVDVFLDAVDDFAQSIDANRSDIMQYCQDNSYRTFLLIGENESFVLLCNIGGETICLGPEEFVRIASGGSIYKARLRYRDSVFCHDYENKTDEELKLLLEAQDRTYRWVRKYEI